MAKNEDAEVEAGAESATSPETAVEASETSVTPTVEAIPADSLDTRVAAFNAELQPLLAKYQLKLFSEPFIENGQILARPVVLDGKPKPDIITP